MRAYSGGIGMVIGNGADGGTAQRFHEQEESESVQEWRGFADSWEQVSKSIQERKWRCVIRKATFGSICTLWECEHSSPCGCEGNL